MRLRPLAAFMVTTTFVAGLSACDGLKEALTAHVDVASRAASQELSVTRLADLLGNAKVPVPITKENANIVGDLWVNYQLLAHAAAVGDSLTDKKAIDKAVEPVTKNARLRKFMDSLTKTFKVDSGSEASYNQAEGDLYAARHILFSFPPAATATQKDSVRQKAQSVLPTVTNANFAEMAGRYSGEPGAKERGGALGVFPKDKMLPAFSNAVAAIKPGQIAPTLVETSYGFHIVQRLPYSAVKEQYQQAYSQVAVSKADSTYLANLDKAAKVEVKSNGPALAKAAAADPGKHHDDDGVLATYKGGDLTTREFLGWLETFPPNMQVTRQLQQAPDSLVRQFVSSIAQREVMLQKADSAKIGLSAEEQTQLYSQFTQFVSMVESQLGIDPKSLADSAKSAPERERLAASRIESYIDKILGGQAQPVPIPQPIATVLRSRYDWSINAAGIDRAVERAQKIRATADSARAANQPKSQVPLPGTPPGAGGGAQPPSQVPLPPSGAQPPARRP